MQKLNAQVKSLLPEYNKYLKKYKVLQKGDRLDDWFDEDSYAERFGIDKFTENYLQKIFKNKPSEAWLFAMCLWLNNDMHFYLNEEYHNRYFKVICKPSNEPELDLISFLSHVEAYAIFGKRLDCKKQVPELIWKVFTCVYAETELYKYLESFTELTEFEKGLLLITLSHFVNSGVNSYIEAKALKPYFTHANYMEFNFQLSSGKLPLLQLKLWKVAKYYKNSDWEITVSENDLIKLVFPNYVAAPDKTYDEPSFTAPEKEEEIAQTGFSVIGPDEMDDVTLFYDPEIQQFVDRIDKILEKCDGDKLKQICGHMLFYGDSGAGKTALAYYLAKKHGYKILKVEASEITSKYVGEDLKNVNACFKAYAKLLQTEKVILLFNEVETLMTARGMANNAAANHYNAFTSEFLIKMEEFRGIAMYTANNVNNFDDAIFRRFLFAKKFTSPSAETRKKLWSTFEGPWNTDESLLANLAAYPLSGAQIKLVMDKHDLINLGEDTMDMDLLWQLLDDEVAMTHIKRKQVVLGKQIGFALGQKQAA